MLITLGTERVDGAVCSIYQLVTVIRTQIP